MGLKIITPPSEELLTLEECREHLRVEPYDDSDNTHPDDTLIMALQAAAREWCENFTGLSIAPKTYELALDAFDDEIELPNPPALEIVSVKYVDSEEAEQTVSPANYTLDDYQSPAWLLPAADVPWPTPGSFINAVKVRFIAGYGYDSDGTELPAAIRAAILLMLTHLYENRSETAEKAIASVPMGVHSLLRPLRIRLGMA